MCHRRQNVIAIFKEFLRHLADLFGRRAVAAQLGDDVRKCLMRTG